jgi:dienelactone hydrolase
MKVLIAIAVFASIPGMAKMMKKPLSYEVDKTKLEGVLVYDDARAALPGLVLVPNWMGVSEANVRQAELVAQRGYVVFVADMFGAGARPKSSEEASKASGALKADRPLMRKRVQAALTVLKAQKDAKLDPKKIGAIGFCFGGTSALELARSGAPLGAVVTFHAGLSSPTPDDAKNITAKVLVLHGADDPFVLPEEVRAFETEMRRAKLDWQLVSFGNAVHSFTDPDANIPGKAQYDEKVARRAYQLMDTFFAEAFQEPLSEVPRGYRR